MKLLADIEHRWRNKAGLTLGFKEIREREPRNLAISASVLASYPEKRMLQTMC